MDFRKLWQIEKNNRLGKGNIDTAPDSAKLSIIKDRPNSLVECNFECNVNDDAKDEVEIEFLFDYFSTITQIGNIPTAYYISNYLAQEEMDYLLRNIYHVKNSWVQLRDRHLQCYGGTPPSAGPTDTAQESLDKTFPKWLQVFVDKLNSSVLVKNFCEKQSFSQPFINHVLINEYMPGEGILHHTDGPMYSPLVLIISLCSSRQMTFKPRSSESAVDNMISVLLEPSSLLVFSDTLYTDYMHGIAISDNCVDIIVDNERCPLINKHLCKQELSDGAVIPHHKRLSLTLRHALF